MTLIAITNPSDDSAEASIVNTSVPSGRATPDYIIQKYGGQLEDGAQIVMVEGGRVWQYLATRFGGSIALRSNDGLRPGNTRYDEDREEFINYIGKSRDSVTLASAWVEFSGAEELETFTAYGINDDEEPFKAVFTSKPSEVEEAAVKAGLVDEGYEDDVRVTVVLKGDQSGVEVVSNL